MVEQWFHSRQVLVRNQVEELVPISKPFILITKSPDWISSRWSHGYFLQTYPCFLRGPVKTNHHHNYICSILVCNPNYPLIHCFNILCHTISSYRATQVNGSSGRVDKDIDKGRDGYHRLPPHVRRLLESIQYILYQKI